MTSRFSKKNNIIQGGGKNPTTKPKITVTLITDPGQNTFFM